MILAVGVGRRPFNRTVPPGSEGFDEAGIDRAGGPNYP